MSTENIITPESTLVRRVSNMIKDGNYSGPPMLFRHSSMQKIRHCCQNLNLFPYLLYSFDNSKSHPVARKVHLCFSQFLKVLTARVFLLYKSLRQSVLLNIRREKPHVEEIKETTKEEVPKAAPRFREIERPKRKENPLFLILAVYFAPFLLAFQVVGLFSLAVFGKYNPGFIFLITALMFLGCISLKILSHQAEVHTVKCEKNKVQ